MLDASTCFDALSSRDPSFDGRFFVGVRTTGVYCRPVCPARTPGRDRCEFFARAVEAEREGYRACFRCRPELAPGAGVVDATPRLVAGAVTRIDEGYLNAASVEDLAASLGVTARHLGRTVATELGVSIVDLARSRRMALATQLLQDSGLPVADVAAAAGFTSVRHFNAHFRARFGRPPSALRRASVATAAGLLVLRLDYRPPLDWDAMVEFLAGRCTAGVEQIEGGAYRRTVRLGTRIGWVSVTRDPLRHALRVEGAVSLASGILPLLARLRALFDLDAHPGAVAAALRRDPVLAPSVRRNPGLRVNGAFDGFESAVRVVLGQQVSVKAATTVAGRVAEALGDRVETPFPGLDRLPPTPEAIVAAGEDRLARIGMPGARARTLIALANAVLSGSLSLTRGADPEQVRDRMLALPGVGPWTANLVAMRALGAPDAFPAGDLGVLRALGTKSAQDAEARAEAWRPWRAYAAMHLWNLPIIDRSARSRKSAG
jgi:AraC family transcriptional regulator of adaptative response / DNA-3-methyladenine glycosylase II